jgi:mRNA interferase MazF
VPVLQCAGDDPLRKGEASLPKPSVVSVSQPVTLDRGRLVARVGALSRPRLRQVLAGICLVIGVDVVEPAG